MKPIARARSRLRRRINRGSPGNGVPSGAAMSQNMRDSRTPPFTAGRIWNVAGSGIATMSDSCTRAKPSIALPSNPMPCSKAVWSSAGVMANDFRNPRTSVNQRRMNRISRSSTVLRTYAIWASRCSSMR